MNKRRYNSIDFKRMDWQGLQNRIEGKRVDLAVDVANEDFVATLLEDEQRALVTFKWVHPGQTPEGLRCLPELKRELSVEAVMELSGTYGNALAWQLHRFGIAVYRVSPKRVHDAAEVYDGVPSLHDAKAAYLIGRLHLQGVGERWQEPSEERREMTALLTQLRPYEDRHQAVLN